MQSLSLILENRKMLKYITTIILFVLGYVAVSQNVIITGVAEHQPDKLVRVITFADLFSNLEQTIAETKTDANGEFALRLTTVTTQFAFIALDLEKGEFYLSPKSNYRINIPMDTSSIQKSIFDRLPLRLSIMSDDGDIQKSIEEFNVLYNDFIYNNINSIYRTRDKSVVMNFVSQMKQEFEKVDSDYVKNYIDYSLASLLWLSRKESNQKILMNYFINKPVLYSNIQYVDFFKEFFKSYFDSEKTFRYEDLIPAINYGSVDNLISLVKRDSILAMDNRVSEIVAMQLLSKYYFDRYVEKERVILKFNEIANISEFEENREVAQNFIIKLQELQSGTKAPVFELVNSIGGEVSLDDFTGNFLLIAFVKENCRMCEFHMPLLKELKNELGFQMLTIVAGNEFYQTLKIADEEEINWPIAKTDNNILLLEDYNIRTYPSYIFINPDGTIAYVNLPMLDENMEVYINRFMEKYKSENKQ